MKTRIATAVTVLATVACARYVAGPPPPPPTNTAAPASPTPPHRRPAHTWGRRFRSSTALSGAGFHAGSAGHPSKRASQWNRSGPHDAPHAKHRQPLSETRSARVRTRSSAPSW
jgi:hypothetical protein